MDAMPKGAVLVVSILGIAIVAVFASIFALVLVRG